MSKYDVHFKRLSLLLLPTFWRRPIFVALTYSATYSIGYLHTLFMYFRTDSLSRLRRNGQVCHMTTLLNDIYDPIDRGIYLSDTEPERGYIQVPHRAQGCTLLPSRHRGYVSIPHRGVADFTPDFIVNLPPRLSSSQIPISQIVKQVKLAGKTFKIIANNGQQN